ncbi:hypothetical protein HCJ58_00945 [Listeria sp. FSL L7-1509]|uniref:Uncharacterized protein n=1 Tax=Listeria immobilis TaxID=2713502 RepID=A0ABR6STK2_9LIST|nr:hypothetical protein [Listeria immobilis]MBC1505553.1 hypothetical protein [Listeria immobilis]MBC1509013.1 hypothetical protein [Listeria immobilis]MBC6303861.1 hypothetical protein [Listeria immobilis]MBC6312377.1 hypothetical protein [Listeria immobilis]
MTKIFSESRYQNNEIKKGDRVQFIDDGRLLIGEFQAGDAFTKDSFDYLVVVETASNSIQFWKEEVEEK